MQPMQNFRCSIVAAALLAGAIVGCGANRLGKKLPPPPHMGPLTVSATAEPDRGDAPLTVEFAAEVYEGDEARDATFEWDFADGSKRAKGAQVKHTFRTPGRYVVRVRVTDAYGRRGEDEVIIDAE
jgi:hypothetical protein